MTLVYFRREKEMEIQKQQKEREQFEKNFTVSYLPYLNDTLIIIPPAFMPRGI